MKELYEVHSLTYKTLRSSRPAYLHSVGTLNNSRSTRSSSLVTLNRPSNPSHLQITKRSFHHTAPALWNRLPPELRPLAPSSSTSPSAISTTLFHKKLKTHLFHSSSPPKSSPGLDYSDGYPRFGQYRGLGDLNFTLNSFIWLILLLLLFVSLNLHSVLE